MILPFVQNSNEPRRSRSSLRILARDYDRGTSAVAVTSAQTTPSPQQPQAPKPPTRWFDDGERSEAFASEGSFDSKADAEVSYDARWRGTDEVASLRAAAFDGGKMLAGDLIPSRDTRLGPDNEVEIVPDALFDIETILSVPIGTPIVQKETSAASSTKSTNGVACYKIDSKAENDSAESGAQELRVLELTARKRAALYRETWERSLGKKPQVIIIGDVHGCVREVMELLRLANFSPGDQVIFTGDLVAKGPDSAGVIRLARQINARTVRGNHDHEVIRWREAVMRGARPPMVSIEHSRVARALTEADFEWFRRAPWYISSTMLGVLIVHAGVVPDTPLPQQNPRMMMNMRSILPDGSVTAKHIKAYGWARRWKGPLRVVFGHDALRGLQLYPHAVGLDTGCVYGGRLTALLLPENRLISVRARKQYIEQRRKVKLYNGAHQKRVTSTSGSVSKFRGTLRANGISSAPPPSVNSGRSEPDSRHWLKE